MPLPVTPWIRIVCCSRSIERGEHRVERDALIGIERIVRFARRRGEPGVFGHDNSRDRVDHAFAPQCGDRSIGAIQRGFQPGRRNRSRLRGEIVKNLALHGIGVFQRIDAADHVGADRNERDPPQRRLLAHHGGQHRFERLPPGGQISLGHPARQPQHRRREQAARVDHFRERFELPPHVGAVFQRHAKSDHRPIPTPKRRPHAPPAFDPIPQRIRHGIIERLIRPGRKNHAGNQLLARIILFPSGRPHIKKLLLIRHERAGSRGAGSGEL